MVAIPMQTKRKEDLEGRVDGPLAPERLEIFRIAASFNYIGDAFSHVGEFYEISPGAARQRMAKIYSDLGVNDLFTAVTILLTEGYFTLEDLDGNIESKLKVALEKLTPGDKSILYDLHLLAANQKSSTYELLASNRGDHDYNKGTLEGAISDIYPKIDLERNRAQLAVIAYAIASDFRFDSVLTNRQQQVIVDAASRDYSGDAMDQLKVLSGNVERSIVKRLLYARQNLKVEDDFSAVVHSLVNGHISLDELKGWNISNLVQMLDKLDELDQQFLNLIFSSALVNKSIDINTINSIEIIGDNYIESCFEYLYSHSGIENNPFQLAVLAYSYAVINGKFSNEDGIDILANPLGNAEMTIDEAIKYRRGLSTDLIRMSKLSEESRELYVNFIEYREKLGEMIGGDPINVEENRINAYKDLKSPITVLDEISIPVLRYVRPELYEHVSSQGTDAAEDKDYQAPTDVESYTTQNLVEKLKRVGVELEIYVELWKISDDGIWQGDEESAQLAVGEIENVLYNMNPEKFKRLTGYDMEESNKDRMEHVLVIAQQIDDIPKLKEYFDKNIPEFRDKLRELGGQIELRTPPLELLMRFYSNSRGLDLFNPKLDWYLDVDSNGALLVSQNEGSNF